MLKAIKSQYCMSPKEYMKKNLNQENTRRVMNISKSQYEIMYAI